ncbi:RNA polymerase sigma factor, sigma-70 family [Micromonospora rhizosphaerae]|uniref:RNA polymerase sigma factor, sigma-70 family n=1 Tax=Micromonospora rhizosphaerae TaxID=568872 RepID=A0A1C6SJ86_9ACTN|nr:sigma-70 family RNA polymerase sigma factor [Micromonospora rhizosphaerae]SCL29415.1 RNA polymerase sigma factor, sigma-70 family [Micromonospora rhizosphaerae]
MDRLRDHEIETLVERVRAGDQAAWVTLTDRYTGLLWSIARAMRLTDEDAADAVQTTWLHMVERLDTLRDPQRLGSWLATTMRRECLAVLRRRARQVPTDSWDDVTDDADPLDGALLRRERDVALWRAFRRLDQPCQALLRVLMADPPPSYREAAEALHTPVGSIGPRRQRCLGKLRTLMRAATCEIPSADASPGRP